MVTVSSRKRLESIERDILPSMFVGVLSKDEIWLKNTLENTLPMLEERALRLARESIKSGECAVDDPLCSEERIKVLFRETRARLEEEHKVRKAHTRFHH